MATEPTIEEVAAAKARLQAAPKGGGYILIDGRLEYSGSASVVSEADLRTLLASLASLEERVQELETLTSEMTLAMFLDCGGDMPTDEPAP